jgi:hypothetical protein
MDEGEPSGESLRLCVKFMRGIFACNEMLCGRFGMAETLNCACCARGSRNTWHVVGEQNADMIRR